MPLPTVIPGIEFAKYYVGRSLGSTGWREITQERIDQFARATGNDAWIHTNPERASRESPWKSTIAQGYLLLSLIPYLLEEVTQVLGWTTAVNAGVDRCSFPGAAPAGSRVRMHGTLDRVRKIPGGGGSRFTYAVEFEVEGADEPACVARVHYVYFA